MLFFVQTAMSVLGMAVCMMMLVRGADPATYLPVASGIVGYWMPCPRMPAPAVVADEASVAMHGGADSEEVDKKGC